jgi:hypothetical protein
MKRDVALAKRVVLADDHVDALQHEIEEKAIIAIALRQPMAIDLRARAPMATDQLASGTRVPGQAVCCMSRR